MCKLHQNLNVPKTVFIFIGTQAQAPGIETV